jgi:hypothetical protein
MPTIAECLEHGRYCEWYAARTYDEGGPQIPPSEGQGLDEAGR